MDKKRWKTVVSSAATLALLSLLIFLVFRKHFQEIMQNIRAVSIGSLLFLLGVSVLYQMLDAMVCFILVRRHLPKFSFEQAVEVVFLGVFGSVSTLSVGSLPMQSYYLHRCGLMAGSGVGTMTLEYVFHKSSILLYTTIMILMKRHWLYKGGSGFTQYLWLGYGICSLIIVVLLLLCSWDRIQRLAAWLIDHLPETEKWDDHKHLWKSNLTALYAESKQLLHDRWCILKVLGLNILKLVCLYSIPFFIMRMLGIAALSFWQVQLLTALMHLISNALPNVAGVGPVEFTFVLVFSHYVEYTQASSALILYRVATFFFPFVLSIFVFLRVQKRVMNDSEKP